MKKLFYENDGISLEDIEEFLFWRFMKKLKFSIWDGLSIVSFYFYTRVYNFRFFISVFYRWTLELAINPFLEANADYKDYCNGNY
jgi:hypothetical protein